MKPNLKSKFYIPRARGGYNDCLTNKDGTLYWPNCVAFVNAEVMRMAGITKTKVGINNAYQFLEQKRFPTMKTPVVGATVIWGRNNDMPLGHVAIVTKVVKSKVTIEHSNWAGTGWQTRYLYTKDDFKLLGHKPTFMHNEATQKVTQLPTDVVASQVIRGEWGNGSDRKDRLTKAGYNYNLVQKRVNQLLK